MKTCSHSGCNNPVYSHDYCRVHQWRRTDEKYLAYKNRKKQGKIPPKESKKRKEDKVYYKQHCEELTAEIKAQNNGKIYCFFSGLEITGKPTYHHLYGRTGDWYADKDGLVPAINEYHLAFHFMPADKLKQEWWYQGFLERLKLRDERLWEKQIGKPAKSNKLNPTLFEDFD